MKGIFRIAGQFAGLPLPISAKVSVEPTARSTN